jgi:hypothetical protein
LRGRCQQGISENGTGKLKIKDATVDFDMADIKKLEVAWFID